MASSAAATTCAVALHARQEAIVADILAWLQARDIYWASGDRAAAAMCTREIGTYGGGYVSLAMQRHAQAVPSA